MKTRGGCWCIDGELTTVVFCDYSVVLGDWKLLTNLLLMDKSAPDLTGDQQSILLAILIAAIRKLLDGYEEQGSSQIAKKNLATEQVCPLRSRLHFAEMLNDN